MTNKQFYFYVILLLCSILLAMKPGVATEVVVIGIMILNLIYSFRR